MSRGARIAYYGLPMLFCLAVHWLDLRIWFYGDDFAWLTLPSQVHSARDLVHVLFSPQAQGTVRTLSERLFFLVFSSLFGLSSPPFRIWVFLTQFASIVLLMQIARRLTGSSLAGFLAAILWCANAGLAVALGWSAAYNEIAFAFCVLLAFRLLLLSIDTGQRKFWIWQWVVFLLGFGALELNVVYPALASGYALCCARGYFRKTLYLFIPSILYTAAHFAFIPAPKDPYYQMHFGASLGSMFWHYWRFAVGAMREAPVDWRPQWLGFSVSIAITFALAWFAIGKLRRREWLPAWMAAWFLVVILLLLPLQNHFTEYYVTVPVIGVAILAAWSISQARGRVIAVAAVLTGLYMTVSISDNYTTEKYFYTRAHKIKYLITALQELPKAEREKKILLAGVDNDFFWSGFLDNPFELIGITEIYLMPGSEQGIDPHPEWGGISRFVIDLDDAVTALNQNRAAVYALESRRLRDVTAIYQPLLSAQYVAKHTEFVDVGNPAYHARLGPSWYRPENGFRWMPKSATVSIARPTKSGQILEVTGYCPAMLIAKTPLVVWFRADGREIGKAALRQADKAFELQFPLPPDLVGKQWMELAIEVSRTMQAPHDVRPLGLIFGTFRIK